MSIRTDFWAALSVPILWLSLTSFASAALNANQADIRENINIPAMAVVINSGGTGCVGHQVWEPTEGGCSDSAYQKTTARVITVSSSRSSLNTGTGSATSTAVLTALVKMDNGKTAPAGLAVTWTATSGTLSSYSGYTDANGQVSVTLSAPKGTAAGAATYTAKAVAGGASTTVNMVNTARVIAVSPSPASVKADGTTISVLTATLAYADGTAVGASETVSWYASIGTLSAAAATTNAYSQAQVSIKSSTVGTSTITATAVGGALSTNVAFTTPVAPAPTISGFSVSCGPAPGNKYMSAQPPGTYCTHSDYYYQWPPAASGVQNILSWSAAGATRYELWETSSVTAGGSAYGPATLLYSGPATSFNPASLNMVGYTSTFTLKAFSGADSTSPVSTLTKAFTEFDIVTQDPSG